MRGSAEVIEGNFPDPDQVHKSRDHHPAGRTACTPGRPYDWSRDPGQPLGDFSGESSTPEGGDYFTSLGNDPAGTTAARLGEEAAQTFLGPTK